MAKKKRRLIKKMSRFLNIFIFIVFPFISANGQAFEYGVDRFDYYGQYLLNKNVAFVGNQTSVTSQGVHTVDFLISKGVKVVKIFSPEHGFRGDVDAGSKVGDYVDSRTNLPVLSLYGSKKKPSIQDMENVDVVVFDIQDVGVRFYTYISTLHYVMEAVIESDLSLIVLDRPNPHASYIDGPILKPECASFVGMHPVPIVYGMTIGEYARMINCEGWIDSASCKLTIVPVSGWKRNEALNFPVKPSPNLPDSVSVMLYPSMCFFEGTIISEGRGTLMPFKCFGHPQLKNMKFSFVPRSIPGMSMSPKCKGLKCYGMDLRDKYEYVFSGRRLRLEWLIAAYKNYSGTKPFFNSFFKNLAGNSTLQSDIKRGLSEDAIRASWQSDLDTFQKIRAKYLLYK